MLKHSRYSGYVPNINDKSGWPYSYSCNGAYEDRVHLKHARLQKINAVPVEMELALAASFVSLARLGALHLISGTVKRLNISASLDSKNLN